MSAPGPGYQDIPAAPPRADGGGVLARLVDGLAFRYRWATEGLGDEHLELRPCDEAMSLGALLEHVRLLCDWVLRSMTGERSDGEPAGLGDERARPASAVEGARAATLASLASLRARVLEMSAAELLAVRITGSRSKQPESFWCIVNGPLADALTHVGQINAWRRVAGIPAPAADVFRGKGPRPG